MVQSFCKNVSSIHQRFSLLMYKNFKEFDFDKFFSLYTDHP